ncbi:D-alanine--D-alanyl carrier protein ligase [Seminavis robusta]|uniref:D-alanine--D-alanyl carrier protein ligase n=1 Tax=Seminavis robusta TaxID=568900 RepID=A0A9N8EVD0_9STRA|nr:D-alanine--D-alanyl carrier protein ligase [Seminavis robusta]|eukprot:Sro1674_g290330.1 D-alanine--D-alanyl carrier protein ligase (1724) ;mRNA; r:3504-9019
MMFHSTILKALSHHAIQTPDKVVFTWVDGKFKEQRKMTFKKLEDESNAVAARLLKLGCKKGDRVMIAYPFGLEFLAGMFGAMKIGVVPCSIYPPNPNQLKTDMPKFRGFAADAGAKYALSTNTFATAMTAASILYKTGVTWIGTDKLSIKKSNSNKPKDYEKFEGETEDICFIQYTSGSTGYPKGVIISHQNLAENCIAISAMSGTNASNVDTTVGALWVPQYHDMGLVAGFMTTLYAGTSLVMASPLDFVANPLLWCDMVETYKATLTCAPNFAYALLLKRLEQANRKADWSCTLSVNPDHIYNIYGLAESVVFLTGGSTYPDSEGLLCCGEVDSPTLKLRIVEDGKEVEEGQVGSIWAQSPRVAAGYYGQPELTAATFANVLPGYDGSWLDTGDLGKIVDGQLYVTGRVKDVIIVNGKNYYPTDVELSIDETFGHIIRPGRTTAFQHGEDSVGITVEGRKDFDKTANESLAVQIANHVSQAHGLFVSEAVVLKLGVTPKTTSGKLKRSEIRQTTVAGDWKESSVLLHFERNEVAAPLPQPHVAVVGAGAAGLTAAIRLAQRNIKVTLLECNEQIGGHARHVEVFGHERNPAFGLFLAEELPNLMVLAEELEVETIHFAGTGQDETIGDFLEQKGFDHRFVVYFYIGKIVSFFPGQKIQDYLNIPLELVAWFVVGASISTKDLLRFQNKEYMEAFEAKLKSLGVEVWTNATPKILSRDDFGVTIRTGKNGNEDILEVDKLVLTVPPKSADGILSNVISPEEHALRGFDCPLETLVLHQDSKWADVSTPNKVVANVPDYGVTLPSFDDTIPITTSLVSDTDHKTPIYVTHAYATHEELDFDSPVEKMSFTHTKITCKATHLRYSLLQHQGKHSTYFAGGWTRGKMLHEDAIVSGILAANSVLEAFSMAPHSVLERETPVPSNQLINKAVTDVVLSDIQPPNKGNFSARYANVVMSAFGSEIEDSKTWAENGMTSLRSAELRNKVEEDLHVVLPANFEQLYPTPTDLADFLIKSEGQSFQQKTTSEALEFAQNLSKNRCTKLQLGTMQSLSLVVIGMLVLVSAVPSFFIGAWAIGSYESTNELGRSGLGLIMLPLAFPLFLFTFSVMVVICKHAVVGKYRPQKIELLSWNYLQWWFLDRLLHMWEVLVGKFAVERKFAWIFYRLLGADLAWSAQIDTFMRESDLIKIGPNVSLKHPLHCRKFHPSNNDNFGPSMSFQSIVIGQGSHVSGMVSPGAIIGESCKVEKQTCVEEGAMVPDGVVANGVPAYNVGSYQSPETSSWEECILDAFKIAWTLVETYHFFALSFLVHEFLNHIIPASRYSTLLHWFLLFPMAALLAMTTSIILKWLLIGKQDPSKEYNGSPWQSATNWACDFHFKIASWPLYPFFGDSRLWNIILLLHGLDVDLLSMLNVNPYTIFVPSKVDFLKVEGSFVGTISIDLKSNAHGSRMIEIIGSSIGYNAHLAAGSKVVRSAVPPRSQLSDSVYDLNNTKGTNLITPDAVLTMVAKEAAQVILNLLIFASLIPSYELGWAAVASSSMVSACFGIALAICLQFCVWLLLSKAISWVTLHKATKPLLPAIFGVYLNHAWIFSSLNWLVMLLYGTPMFGRYARFMGAEVDGDLWYFGSSLYEYGKLHFKGCTIVDSAHVTGHYVDGNGATIDDTFVTGVLHPGCYAPAGSVVSGEENGPWKVFYEKDAVDKTYNFSDSLENTAVLDAPLEFPLQFEV